MAANRKGLTLSLVTQGAFPASEQIFEQSYTPFTIISALPNSLHFVHHAKNLFLNCFTADN